MQVVFGTGALDLPRAFANLGWVLGVASLVLFGSLARYAGGLLYRLRAEFFPATASYAQAAEAAVGARFSRLVAGLVMANWFLMLPYYLVGASTAMMAAFGESEGTLGRVSQHQWLLLLALPLAGLLQAGTLHAISSVAAVSNAAMLAACAIAVVSMLAGGVEPGATHHLGPPPSDFLTAYSYMSSLIFAYQGHGALPAPLPRPLTPFSPTNALTHGRMPILHCVHWCPAHHVGAACTFIYTCIAPACAWMSLRCVMSSSDMYYEVMREMEAPAEFPRALGAANNGMVASYLLLAAVTYGVKGDATPSFLLDAIPQPRLRAIASVLLVAHILVTYLLVNQPLCEKIHRRVVAAAPRLGARVAWAAVTLAVLTSSLAIAAAVPFFAVFQNLLGAMLGAPIVFGGPAWMYARCCAAAGRKLSLGDRLMVPLMLGVLFPLCTALGTWTALAGLVAEWRRSS